MPCWRIQGPSEAKEAKERERVHDLLLEEFLEEEREWLDELQDWFQGCGLRVKQREAEQSPDCPLTIDAEHQSELSIRSPIGMKPNEVEPTPRCVARVERLVYRKGSEEAMQSEFDGHMKTGTFHMVDRVPEGRKYVSSKWWFDCKTDKEGKMTKVKARLVARGLTQIHDVDYTYSSSLCPSLVSIKLVLAVANEKTFPFRHYNVVQACIRASLDEEVYMKLPRGCGGQSKRTAKLERVNYGLKQSGRK